jgi:hypothetical protein
MITERMMQRLLYQAFIAEEIESSSINLADWRWPWKDIVLTMEARAVGYDNYSRLAFGVELVAGDRQQSSAWLEAIMDAKQPMSFPSLAEIADSLEPVSWLWQEWLPRGMVSILGAFQGAGKSFFVMDLARVTLHGDVWPDGAPVTHDTSSAKVVYVDAESIPQVNNQRAQALGLDSRRLYLMMADTGEMIDLTKQHWRDHMLDLAYTVKPDLIIVDSLSTITTSGTNAAEEVSGLFAFLNGLARESNSALLLLHHLRKPGGGQLSLPGVSIHDFRGSTHIVAMARSVLGLSVVQQPGKQFSLNGPRHVEIVKTNLTTYPEKLEVRMERPAEDVVRFAYGPVGASAPDEPSPDEWLIDYLVANGPSHPDDIVAAAESDGISRSTLYRARKRLGDQIVKQGQRKADYLWLLASDVDVEESDAEDATDADGEDVAP